MTDEHAKGSSQQPTRETATGGASRAVLEYGRASPLINYPKLNNCLGFGCGYIYGFRVPLLVVSAYTTPGYVSGACQAPGNCLNEVFPFKHDFGSILGFIENNFLGSTAIGAINSQNHYPFADAFAPDLSSTHVPLADFFSATYFQNPRPFEWITLPPGWQSYNADYFINYFANGGLVLDPDSDVADDD